MKIDFPEKFFEKYWEIKLNEKYYSGSRVDHEGGKGRDTTKFIIAFRNFKKTLKKDWC